MHLPGRTAVSSAIQEYAELLRSEFHSDMKSGRLQFGGAVTIDGVHLKVQGKHFYDFTLLYIEIRQNTGFEEARFVIRTELCYLLSVDLFQTRVILVPQ